MTAKLVYSEADLLAYDPFEGCERDLDVRCRATSMVTTRKAHACAMAAGRPHEIAPGARARYEKAIVDGVWGRYYVCVPCMTRWLRERGIRPGGAQ